ncbi:SDR family oxidoreductase [Bdellovibrio sp. HCB274]|uniref:SDR family oxidoreductase n=1 Tax=Bdellovibrio sp. HCB274 TaxID=3394361 RepID=UPI0039B4AEB6
MKLTDQTILITGGGSGIGLGLAEAFKKMGNQVIVAGRSQSKLEMARAKGFETLTVDMTSQESIEGLAKEAIQKFPNLNCVIHNAGIMKNEKLINGDNAEAATDTVLTNLLGPILLNSFLLPHFKKQKAATIITVTSGLAYVPLSMTPTYCATKAGIHSYTESLRFQLKDTAIEVKEIVPPYVQTHLMGERQANDPNAMPLDEFINEVISILKNNPSTDEVIVQRAASFRQAAYKGEANYKEMFNSRNEFLLNARKTEWDAL